MDFFCAYNGFCLCTTMEKTVFLGLRQFAFSKSNLLTIVQAIVRIVRDYVVGKRSAGI